MAFRYFLKAARRQRGSGFFVVLLGLLGIGAVGLLIQDSASYFENLRKEREMRSGQAVREAERALVDYMLLRAKDDLDIAQGNAASVRPRLLMLPCPDNVSDGNLDGSQDAGCAAATSSADLVNDILSSGSRFGRLPWRSRNVNAVNHSLNDGIDLDLRDSGGNRLWYALSRNLAPSANEEGLPFNLHRLMTHDKDWLTVVNQYGVTVAGKIVAVILAPGDAFHPRVHEAVLATATALDVAAHVKSANGILAPSLYFESRMINGGVQVFANYNKDGIFIQAPRDDKRRFNDTLAYINLDQLAGSRHFMNSYRLLLGVSKVHNAPGKGRPLANLAEALEAYHALFGFYPSPAQQGNPAHLSRRARHCALYHSGDSAYATDLAAGVMLSPAVAVTVHAFAGVSLTGTMMLAQTAAFLLRQNATVAAAATVIYGDVPLTVASLTLARYARLTLQEAVLAISMGGLQNLTGTIYRLSAAMPAVLVSAASVAVMPKTPLAPTGSLIGWLAEHTLAYKRAANDGAKLTLFADTRAMFWTALQLTNAVATLTVGSNDVLTLAAGDELRLEEDYDDLQEIAAVIFYPDRAVSIRGALPTPAGYNARQFAVWLLADAARAAKTIAAPALLHPWRQKKGSNADSRDNLHDYPPCFDMRNFFGRQFHTMLQDQPMVYAVAEACHYGGETDDCGVRGGLTVSLAAGAALALPQAVTLTHSYTVAVGGFQTVTLQNGVLLSTLDVSLYRDMRFPVLDRGGETLAAFQLTAGHRFAGGGAVVLPAQTPLIGGTQTVLENVSALLIYSSAPLLRAACINGVGGIPPPVSGALSAVGTLVNQQKEANDITNLCYWLDDEENADGDDFYTIYGEETRAVVSPRNDYFIVFGGQARIG